MPKISVIMPVLNGEKYLREAIESILGQSFDDFEFIIINDGSVDKTEEIIRSYKDARIVYIKNDKNLGLSRSFNIGINATKGLYIARMDADDISLPDRFKKQMEFLKTHPDIEIVGGKALLINKAGKKIGKLNKPETHVEIKWQSLFSTPLIHPTVMARATVLKDNLYDETLYNSEDYELWSRLIFQAGVKLANLPEPVLKYRVYPESFTQSLSFNKRQTSAMNAIANIERYTLLSGPEKEIIIRKPHTLREVGMVFGLYRRAAKEFQRKEKFKPNLSQYFLTLICGFFL
ncbi:MAG: glycosyltransferase [bacterium]|nr:glycosyltransferase [bacterium]